MTPPVSMSEWQLLEAILEAAKLGGYLAYHTHDSRKSVAGFPDLVLVGWGQVIFAELKTETGRVTPEQQMWLDALALCGATVCVWRPRDLDAVLVFLTSRPKEGAGLDV